MSRPERQRRPRSPEQGPTGTTPTSEDVLKNVRIRALDQTQAQALRAGYTMFLPNGTPCR